LPPPPGTRDPTRYLNGPGPDDLEPRPGHPGHFSLHRLAFARDPIIVRVIRIGTRGSALALKQSEQVRALLLERHAELTIELEIIKTRGDKILDVPLAKVGGKGLFVKEIEDALLAGTVDLAVHSMKDVPSELPAGLCIGAVPRREDPRDVLVANGAGTLAELPPGARVGTSSLRRAAQLMRLRPDLKIENLRGNLDTRLGKVRDGCYDAVVLAAAGLRRMGWTDAIGEYLEPERFVPAIGQGALGLEIRRDDPAMAELIGALHDPETALTVTAERAFLLRLDGGCQVPIGGHARLRQGGMVELTGLVAAVDGSAEFRLTRTAPAADAEALGRAVAEELLALGAGAVLAAVYGTSEGI